MTNVAQVLSEKMHQAIYTIRPDSNVLEAITLMADTRIGALVVTHDDKGVGMLSSRDSTRKIALMQRTSFDTTVNEIMTSKVITVNTATSVEDCLSLMTERHLRHLPVVEHEKLIGLISIGDL